MKIPSSFPCTSALIRTILEVQSEMAHRLYSLYRHETRLRPGNKVQFYEVIAEPCGGVMNYSPATGILTVSTGRADT